MDGLQKKAIHQYGREIFFLYPPIKAPYVTKYGNTVVFRQDDVVDWIDVWVSNADGDFHTVAEFVDQYGFSLDRVYINMTFDMAGPDQVYIWSECGIAITAVSPEFIEESLPADKLVEPTDYQLNFRYPVHPRSSLQPTPDVKQIVIRKFLFQPTNFSSFQEFYAKWIRHLKDKRLYRAD